MSDPVEMAIANHHSLQEMAFEDFDRWRQEREDDCPADIEEQAEGYARDCESGAWAPHAWRTGEER